MSDTILRKGQRVTCPHGHYIATVARDIECGSKIFAEDFSDLQGPPMTNGDKSRGIHGTKIGRCVCGALWGYLFSLHIEGGGWIPPLTPENAAFAARKRQTFPDDMPAYGRIEH